jgi:Xaa-Pro aminopeptidase
VTRTFPIGKQFTKAQRRVYEIVLQAQLAGIEAVRPGVGVDVPHQRAVEVLVEGLLSIGLLEGEKGELIKNDKYRSFFMHRTSHWLGMDVHDVGTYKTGESFRALEPGMVLTVEPGLYIAADAEQAAAEFRGIGVRIEDDVLVTADGHEVLSAGIVKDPGEIEDIRARNG